MLRGDNDLITIGEGVNVQDGCVIHTDEGLPVTLERNVSIGTGAKIIGPVRIGEGATIGANANVKGGSVTVVDGSDIRFNEGALRALKVIAPEGTREATTEWRSGFYRIALAAGMPIVPVNSRRSSRLLVATGDVSERP